MVFPTWWQWQWWWWQWCYWQWCCVDSGWHVKVPKVPPSFGVSTHYFTCLWLQGFVNISALLVTAVAQYLIDGAPPTFYVWLALPLVVGSTYIHTKYPYKARVLKVDWHGSNGQILVEHASLDFSPWSLHRKNPSCVTLVYKYVVSILCIQALIYARFHVRYMRLLSHTCVLASRKVSAR